MNLNLDYLIERKRHKKQIVQWKIISLSLIVFLISSLGRNYLFDSVMHSSSSLNGRDHLGRVEINNIISDDLDKIKNLEKIIDNKKVKAIILHINSPGGSVVGS